MGSFVDFQILRKKYNLHYQHDAQPWHLFVGYTHFIIKILKVQNIRVTFIGVKLTN